MKQIFTILSLFLCLSLAAQTTQKGVVKEYNEKAQKTPLSGVEFKISKASSTTSDAHGRFKLEFLTLKPGEQVNVHRIEKLGYEVFNKEAVEQWNINPNEPFIVVMCRSDRFKKIRDNYEFKASENYKKQFVKSEKELLRLKEQGKIKQEEFEKQKSELIRIYEKQLDNLDNFIDRISRIDLSEISTTEQQIIDLVQKGEIDEAIRLYDDLKIPEKLAEQIKNQNKALDAKAKLDEYVKSNKNTIDSLYAMADRQIDMLKYQGRPENIGKIISIYNDIVNIDSTNINWNLKAGLYVAEYTADYELARSYYKRALDQALIQYGESHYVVAMAYNNIASTFHFQGNLREALRNYETAFNMRLEIFGPSHPEVASSYNNIGMVLSDLRDPKSALEVYNTALDIRLKYYDASHPLIAQSYTNIATAYHYQGDFKNALKYGLIALEKKKVLLDEGHPDLATSYNNVGAAYMDCGELDKALEYTSKGLEMREEHFGNNHSSVAESYNTMGAICFRKNDFRNAQYYFDKALDIRRSLLGEQHKDVAQSYNNAASAYAYLGETGKALEYYRTALSIYEKTLGPNHPKTISTKRSIQNLTNSIQ